jgi:hypothetical protein
MSEVQTTAQETTPAPTAAAPEAPNVTLDDLANAAQIIGAAIERGAFKAPEMSGVAKIYDKITNFLKFVEESQKKGE